MEGKGARRQGLRKKRKEKENCLSLEAKAHRGTSESRLAKPAGTHLGSAEDSMIRTEPGPRLACLVCAALFPGPAWHRWP